MLVYCQTRVYGLRPSVPSSMGLVLVAKILALMAPAGVSERVTHNTSTLAADPENEMGLFRGGHAENQIVAMDACEFKKTQEDQAGARKEADFLKTASADPFWSGLVPKFIRAEDHEGQLFMVMHMVTCGFKNPIIADFKLGTQSWKPAFRNEPGASSMKIIKMDARDSASTTKSLGVRITSVQMPPSTDTWVNSSVPADAAYQVGGRVAVKRGLTQGSDAWKAGKTEDQFNQMFQAYLPTPALRAEFVKQLQPFLDVFSAQKTYRFTGVSLFVFYDGEGAGSSHPKLGMKLIDFPHTLGSPGDEFGELDSGVLAGLNSLHKAAVEAGTATAGS